MILRRREVLGVSDDLLCLLLEQQRVLQRNQVLEVPQAAERHRNGERDQACCEPEPRPRTGQRALFARCRDQFRRWCLPRRYRRSQGIAAGQRCRQLRG